MAVAPINPQLREHLERQEDSIAELAERVQRLTEAAQRAMQQTNASNGLVGTTGMSSSHTHSIPVPTGGEGVRWVMDGMPIPGTTDPLSSYERERARLLEEQRRLRNRVAELESLLFIQSRKVPQCDPNAFRCCDTNFVDDVTWACHVMDVHIGIEEVRRLVTQYPDKVEPTETQRRIRRSL